MLSMQGRNTLAVTGNSSSVLSAEVVRVIDGDTIEVCCIAWRRESVRYIGVNTPETHHATKGVEAYGKEAAEANAKLVTGKTVRRQWVSLKSRPLSPILAGRFTREG